MILENRRIVALMKLSSVLGSIVVTSTVARASQLEHTHDEAWLRLRRDEMQRRLAAVRDNLIQEMKRKGSFDDIKKSPRRRRRGDLLVETDALSRVERAGLLSGKLCSQRSKVGGKPKTVPSGSIVKWADGNPSVEHMECEMRLGQRLCCRPSAERLATIAQKWPAYWRTLERFAMSSGGSPESWRCFPSLVIAGAQKCGTTALTGLLMHHPKIEFSRQKELHYFDKNESQCAGALPYVMQFPEAGSSSTAEATPFYLADTMACARIKSQLPHAKLVVLVREPVARARSEYEMKHRRVLAQDDFRASLVDVEVSSRMLECIIASGPHNVSAGIAGCAPKRLRDNAKFNMFRSAVIKRIHTMSRKSGIQQAYGDYIRTCFKPSDLETSAEPIAQGIASAIFSEPLSFVTFDVEKCFAIGTKERVAGDFGSVLLAEIHDLNGCANRHFDWGSRLAPPTPRDAARLISACVKVHTGITIQYVYRGLYAAQLARCSESVPIDDILVLEADELRHQTQSQLDKVADHLLLPRFTYDTALFEPANLQHAIREKYPSFENSGWQLATAYKEPLPTSLVADIKAFYKPHNRLLFQLIGRDFPHWDKIVAR